MIASSIAVILAASCVSYPLLGLPRRLRLFAMAPPGLAILAAPLLIEPGFRPARLLVAIFAAAEAIKLFDLHVGAGPGRRPDFRAFLLFLINPTSVVFRKLDHEPRPGRRADLIRLGRAGMATGLGVILLSLAFGVGWRPWPFAAEHCAKVVAFFLMVVPLLAMVSASWRLAGGRGRDFMENPFAARTPADFWRRYNRPAQQFFREDVFRLLGGKRHPLRMALATFFVSALLHEYAFDVGAGRVQGYQTAFFLLQGGGMVATMGIRLKGWRRYPWMAATFAFNLATGALFFASLDEVVPFYERR